MSRDTDTIRRQKAGLSKRMKAEAEARRCPECRRKSAIKRRVIGTTVLRMCRWCGYEDMRMYG